MSRIISSSFLYVLLLANVLMARAQTTGWALIPGGNSINNIHGSCFDKNGNSYLAGSFENAPIEIGGTTLLPVADKDAFIASFDASGNARWAKAIGGAEIDQAQAIRFDSLGNVFAAGNFNSSSIFIDGTTLSAHSGYDFFIVKYDSLGHLLWAANPDQSNGNESLFDIAIDHFGNLYAIGSFDGSSITLGAFTLQNPNNGKALLLFKMDPSGTVLWAKTSMGAGDEAGTALTLGSQNDVFIAGAFNGVNMTLQGQSLENRDALGTSSDVFYAHYDRFGSLLMLAQAGGNGQDHVSDILFTNESKVVLTGTFDGPSIQFNNQSYLYNAGLQDVFVTTCRADGATESTQAISGSGDERSGELSLESDGGFLLCGGTNSLLLNPGNTAYLNQGGSDIFLARFHASGQLDWTRMLGAEGHDEGFQAHRLANGSIILCGNTDSQQLSLPSNIVSPSGRMNAFICSFASTTSIASEMPTRPLQIVCMPNPTKNDLFYICPFHTLTAHPCFISLNNSAGECFYKTNTVCKEERNRIELQDVPNGIYNLQIISGNKTANRKICINH